MAVKKAWMAVTVVLLFAGFVMAGCPQPGDGSGSGLGVGGLPDLGGDKTGLPADLEEPDLSLEPGDGMTAEDVAALDIVPDYFGNGVKSWSIENGKPSFELETPEYLEDISELLGDGLTVTGSAEMAFFYGFWSDGYDISRSKYETDEKTYERSSRIMYYYVSDDVTITSGEEQDKGSDDGVSWDYTYKASKLELKKGWNLVQTDMSTTFSETGYTGTVAVKIADKDVPWTVTYDDYDSAPKANGHNLTKGF
jgi:hypothetical protein